MPAPQISGLLRHLKRLAPPGSGELTDRQLLERFARHGDESAFADLVRRHGPLLLGVGRRILHDHHDAEDVFQATFVILARHASSRRWQTSIAGWLYCVASRLALRMRADGVRRRERERAAGTGAASAGPSDDHRELWTSLDEELLNLGDQVREPLLICYLQGKTRDQAARQLGWSLRTLERRLNQGLKLLRARLEKRGIEVPMALLAAGLSQQAASAALSPTMVTATVHATLQSGSAAAGISSALAPEVAALVEGGPRAMIMKKLTAGVLVLLVIGAAAAWIGGARDPQPAAKSPDEPRAVEQRVIDEPKKPAPVATVWPEGTTVQGRVVDQRGAAVANAEVLLLGAERVIVEANRTWFVLRGEKELPKPPSVRTNASGEFSIARKQGPADRLVVIAQAPLFWSVARAQLPAGDQALVKLPPTGSLAIRCDLPGKAAKQPVMIELQGAGRDSDFLRFHSMSYSVANPGEKVFEHLPPGEYIVQRAIETPTGKGTVLMTMADRQPAKVEPDKRATVHFERKTGRPLTGHVRGLENIELRYGHVSISYSAPEEKFADGRTGRMLTGFDVLPIQSDGRFTTDPLPPGQYSADIFVVRATTLEQSTQQSDFHGRLQFTVPEQGEMPKIEIVAKPNTQPPPPNRDYRARVIDETGQPVPALEAMIHTATAGYTPWKDGRQGMVGFGDPLLAGKAEVIDVLVRAKGYAPAIARLQGEAHEKLRRGEVAITMRRGQKVEVRFRLPEGLAWPEGKMPEAYFADLEERVRMMRQPANRKRGDSDFNMLNLQPVGAGRFECRLAQDTPPFHVAIHVPGFLQCFETGPFTLASFKQGILEIDVPRPAGLDIRFDPAANADVLPFKSVTLQVMRQVHGNTYLEVATDVAASVRHELRLTDLAPGPYLVSVRTEPKPESKPAPGTEINPGAYYDQKKLVAAAGTSERVSFGYTPFDASAFRGQRSAVVRIRMPDGTPAKGRQVSVGWFDGHYGSLPVFAGKVPDSGELLLKELTDRTVPALSERPYTVSVDDERVGQFGFTSAEPVQEFEFRLAPQAGDLAPDVELVRLATGKAVRLSSLRGKIVCLEFWATWCGPCQPAMAKLNALQSEQAQAWKDRVVVIPLSVDAEVDRVRSHVSRRGWKHLDHHWTGKDAAVEFDAPAARAFVVNGVPETILIGRDGRILWRGHPMQDAEGQSVKSRIDHALTKSTLP